MGNIKKWREEEERNRWGGIWKEGSGNWRRRNNDKINGKRWKKGGVRSGDEKRSGR